MPPRLIAGVMSGTSADGVDVALVEFAWGRSLTGAPASGPRPAGQRPAGGSEFRPTSWRLRGFAHRAFRRAEREVILAAATGAANAEALAQLHVALGRRYGQAVLAACRASGIPPRRLALIASHGQTVFHRGRHATLQLGDAATIAAITGVDVVHNFRAADIAAGGEGAPLVPWTDWRLFTHPTRYRATLNLGGIANLTLLPPGARRDDVLGFDTGPANILLDACMRHLSRGRQSFDRNGRLARAGNPHPKLLAALLQHSYFRRRPPKSCGREEFGQPFLDRALRLGRTLPPADLMATLVALTASTVAQGLRCGGPDARSAEVIVSGGGAGNRALMAALRQAAPACTFSPSDDFGLPARAREAVAFAFLGEAFLRREPANLPRVTGARYPALLGSFTPRP
ncbi:MAG: anhydro-N-acetylmuramic acid kinase [Terriglobales bacterium]